MQDHSSPPAPGRNRLSAITLDPKSLGRSNANVEHEREVAIFDILDGNVFAVEGVDQGPYGLNLLADGDRLQFEISGEGGVPVAMHQLTMAPLKRVIKDYFMVCESYYEAVRTAPPARIQAIDVNRRALHDEGSKMLSEKLQGKITTDADTARRLFTLVCALHWKG